MSNDSPTTIMKQFRELFADFSSNDFNSCLENGISPDEVKLAVVVPVHKKNDEKDRDASVCFQIYQ